VLQLHHRKRGLSQKEIMGMKKEEEIGGNGGGGDKGREN